jgi:ATP-binding cassette, subfamily B, multidrug efflux pump
MRQPRRASSGEERWSGTDLALLGRLVPYGMVQWKPLLLSMLLLPVVSGAQLVQPYLLKVAIDGPIADRDLAGLTQVAALLLIALVGQYLLQFVQSFSSHVAGQGIVHDLRVSVHGHLLRLNSRFYLRNPAGRLLTRCTNDVEGIGEMFAAGFLMLFADLLLLLGICVAMLWLDLRLALVTFASLPILLLGTGWFQRLLRSCYREIRKRTAILNSYLQESISGIRVIQLFGREPRTTEQFEERNRALIEENFRSIRLDAILFAFVEMMRHVVTAALIWCAAKPILDPESLLSFGVLVAFLDYLSRFFQPIRDLSQKVASLQSGLASSERVFALLDETEWVEEIALPQEPSSRSSDASNSLVEGAVSFENVHFSYLIGESVLQDLSLTVRAGERVALLGVTGAGKTTALRLVNRVHDADSGRVLLDGVDVTQMPLSTLRRAVGVVPQEVFLFMGSVRDNLAIGADSSDEQLWDVLERVGAAALVRKMGGLDAMLGERAGNISAGERQLLAFARVLAYDPAVLLLDEATSNVDSFSEMKIQEAITTSMEGRTTIVVAHRLSTIQQVDRILVLSQGQVAEEGSHSELMERRGLYRRFFESYFAASEAQRAILSGSIGVQG